MEVIEALHTRRSVRSFTTDNVDDTQIESLLDAARWAPSWSNSQCWKFVVVRDPQVKEQLANTLLTIQLPDRIVDNPAKKSIYTAPVVIVTCAQMEVSGGYPGKDGAPFDYSTDKGDWFMFDTALAVQNICLAAHAQGLGTVIIGAFNAVAAASAINAPYGIRAVAMLPVGYPAKEGKAPPRRELSEFVICDRW